MLIGVLIFVKSDVGVSGGGVLTRDTIIEKRYDSIFNDIKNLFPKAPTYVEPQPVRTGIEGSYTKQKFIDGVKHPLEFVDIKERYDWRATVAKSYVSSALDKIPILNNTLKQITVPLSEYKTRRIFDRYEITNKRGFEVLIVPPGEKIYKGMMAIYPLDFSYPKRRAQSIWYGSTEIAIQYCFKFTGGINAYKFNRQTTLMIISYRNMILVDNLLRVLIKHGTDENKELYKTIQNIFRLKMGIRINPAYRLSKLIDMTHARTGWRIYTENEDVKKRYFETSDVPCLENIYMSNFVDKLVYSFLAVVNSYLGFEGSHKNRCYSHYELSDSDVVLTDTTCVDRDITDPIDTEQWKHLLGDKMLDDFALNTDFALKNQSSQITNFYQTAVQHSGDALNLPKSKVLRLATMNIHSGESINALHKREDALQYVKTFMESNDIDVMGLQEVGIDTVNDLRDYVKPFHSYYHTISGSDICNMVVTKHQCKTYTVPLPDKFYARRNMIVVRYDGYKIGVVHLAIFYDRKRNSKLLEQNIKKNVSVRVASLDIIQKHNLDIVMGDFNFNRNEPEYEIMRGKGYVESDVNNVPTTPFGTTVDFIWHRPTIKIQTQVMYSIYTDHRPVVGNIMP